jgi:hypothetical protein
VTYELGTLVWYPIILEGDKRDCLPGVVVHHEKNHILIFWSDLMETKHILGSNDLISVYTSREECQKYVDRY